MDDLFEKRRSIRRFTDRAVDDETLAAVLEAARWAPSWGNLQCAELVVIKAAETKAALAELLSAKNPASLCTKNAPVVIAVCGAPLRSGYYKGEQSTRYQHWFLYDLGLVSQNICLKACELGLGTVIVGAFDHQRAEQILKVPEGCELVALIPLGYPDQQPSAPRRREMKEFVHEESF